MRAIGAWCEAQGVDAWYRAAPHWVVSARARPGRRERRAPSTAPRSSALDGDARRARAATRRCSAARSRSRTGATVHPARLAFGLRERLVARGVRDLRGLAGARRCAGDRCGAVVAETAGGRVRAGAAVVAVNAASGALRAAARPPDRRLQPHRAHRAGARRDRGARLDRRRGDHRRPRAAALLPHHARRADPVRLGRRADGLRRAHAAGAWRSTPRSSRRRARDLVRFFPALAGPRGSTHAWGGPIDVSPTHLPAIVSLPGRPRLGGVRLHRQRRRARRTCSAARWRRSRSGARRGDALRARRPAARDACRPSRCGWPARPRSARALVRKEAAEEAGGRADPLTRGDRRAAARCIGLHIVR